MDPRRAGLLERMIANLIDNGIRHNEPGGRLPMFTQRDATRCGSSSPTAAP